MILTSSAVMITASAAPTAELITYGDVLALSNKGNTIYSMDEVYFKAGMTDDEAILTSSKNPFDDPITALAKSGDYLFIGLLNGMFFRLENIAPGEELDYWSVDFDYSMPKEYGHITSLTVSEEGGVYVTTAASPFLWVTAVDALSSGFDGFVKTGDLSEGMVDGYASFSMMPNEKNDGWDYIFTDEGSYRIGMGFISNSTGSFELHSLSPLPTVQGKNGRVRAVPALTIPSNESGKVQHLALTPNGIQMFTHTGSSALLVEGTKSMPEAINAGSELYASLSADGSESVTTTLMPTISPGSGTLCFPITTTFGAVAPFDGTITLNFSGVEKTLTHEQLDNQSITWTKEKTGLNSVLEDACDEPNDLTFRITEASSKQDIELSTSKKSGGVSYTYTPDLFSPRVNWESPLNVVNAQRFDRSFASPENFEYSTSIQLITVDPAIFYTLWVTMWENIIDNMPPMTELTLESAEIIQSVFSPTYLTQKKAVYWKVTGDMERTGMDRESETVTIRLTVNGVTKSYLGGGSMCHTQYMYRNALLPVGEQTRYLAGEEQVRTLVCDFEVPLSALNEGVIIPHSENDINDHSFAIYPASPNSRNYVLGAENALGFVDLTAFELDIVELGEIQWKIELIDEWTFGDDPTDTATGVHTWHTIQLNTGRNDGGYKVLIVPTDIHYQWCNDWEAWHWEEGWLVDYPLPSWNVCNSGQWRHQWSEVDDSADTLEKTRAGVQNYLQNMYPFENGEVEVRVLSTTVEVFRRNYESTWDWVNRKIERTLMTFDIIDRGMNILSNHPQYDRVVMLTKGDAFVRDGEKLGGWFGFSGISPCSPAVIAKQDTKQITTTVHEIGHSILLSHDNIGFLDSTINNCGDPSTNPRDNSEYEARGWTPEAPPGSYGLTSCPRIEPGSPREYVGESFMRYEDDGETYDPEYTPCGYGVYSWITNDDYLWAQFLLDYDSGSSYMDRYLAYILLNLVDWVVDLILEALEELVTVAGWMMDLIREGVAWLVDSISETIGGRSAIPSSVYLSGMSSLDKGGMPYATKLAPSFSQTEFGTLPCFECNPSSSDVVTVDLLDTENNIIQTEMYDATTCLDENYTDCSLDIEGQTVHGMGLRVYITENTARIRMLNSIGDEIWNGTIPAIDLKSVSMNLDKTVMTKGDPLAISWSVGGEAVDIHSDDVATTTKIMSGSNIVHSFTNNGGTGSFTLDTSRLPAGTYSATTSATFGGVTVDSSSVEFLVSGNNVVDIALASETTTYGEQLDFAVEFSNDISEQACTILVDGATLSPTSVNDNVAIYEFRPTQSANSTSVIQSSCDPSLNTYITIINGAALLRTGIEVEHILGNRHQLSLGSDEGQSIAAGEGFFNKLSMMTDEDGDGTPDDLEVCITDGVTYEWHDAWVDNFFVQFTRFGLNDTAWIADLCQDRVSDEEAEQLRVRAGQDWNIGTERELIAAFTTTFVQDVNQGGAATAAENTPAASMNMTIGIVLAAAFMLARGRSLLRDDEEDM